MPGPRPKPTRLRVIQGNPSNRPLPENEPDPAPISAQTQPPADMTGEELEVWHRIVGELEATRMITEVDVTALAILCRCIVEQAHAAEKFKLAPVLKTKTGYFYISPWHTHLQKSRQMMLKLFQEFGMTPSSRTRVRTSDPTPKPGRPGNKWDKHKKKKRKK